MANSLQPPGSEGALYTVLVVDDQPSVRTLIRAILSFHSYCVLEAGSGDEAVDVAGRYQGEISCFLIDLLLPRVNGTQIARLLDEVRPGAVSVFMSGMDPDTIADQRLLEPGMNFIYKPFNPAQLLEKIREACVRPATGDVAR